MIPRASYQVLVFDLPNLGSQELEAAARFRVRSLSPLHPDQYQVYLDVFKRGKGVTVLAFLVPGDLSPGPQERASFPARLPRRWPQDLILVHQVDEVTEFYVYHSGYLKVALPPAHSPKAKDEAWAALQRENPGLPVETRSFAGLSRSLFPRLHRTLPRDRSLFWAFVPLVLGVGLLVWGGTQYLDRLGDRNKTWAIWLEDNSRTPGLEAAGLAEKRWNDLSTKAGFPLLGVLERLAGRWPDDVRIVTFDARENQLQIEAESTNAVNSVENLLADPWFHSLKVVRIRTNDAGRDTFLLEGTVTDD